MILEKAESRKIKHRALLWLRLDQRCAFIATEAGGYNSDALGVNEKKMIEIEVKTSLEDLKNDFKKHKHSQYFRRQGDAVDFTSNNQWVPTHFYFCVTPDLVDQTKELIEKMGYNSYGVLNGETMKVEKRAKPLHTREPNSKVKFILALRMGSELIRFHEAMF